MNRILIHSLWVLLALGTPTAVTAESPHTFSANTALTTDYLFRGVSQTDNNPAIQGGFDYSYDSDTFADPYVGIWASNVEFRPAGPPGTSDPASIEIDYYGGLTGDLGNTGITWDVGGIYYHYPGQDEDQGGGDFDYAEAYGNLAYTFDSVQFEPTVGAGIAYTPEFFGEDDTGVYFNGSLDLSLPYDVGLGFLVGHQDVEGDVTSPGGFDYTHYSISLSKSIKIFNLSLSWNDEIDNNGVRPDLLEENLVFTISSSF